MEKQFGFTKITPVEFSGWLSNVTITRPIKAIQQHHTWRPNYSSGNNYFDVQRGMKNFHVQERHFSDIAQHFSIFNDGSIMTGRDLNVVPAGIKGNNTGYVCIENVGDFDLNRDQMTAAQKEAIILVMSELIQKLGLELHTGTVVYHHWFDLDSGRRTDGAGNTKTCPGTGFFGGNRVSDCEANFLTLISQKSGIPITVPRDGDVEEPTFVSPEDYQDVDEIQKDIM